ncbi:hypothetical protein [Undibacterium curvum]|uniref:hypothetical protein n=1 Tax=Undibacterium curvum TaxID=2762294 RepID=UPI003D13BBBB
MQTLRAIIKHHIDRTDSQQLSGPTPYQFLLRGWRGKRKQQATGKQTCEQVNKDPKKMPNDHTGLTNPPGKGKTKLFTIKQNSRQYYDAIVVKQANFCAHEFNNISLPLPDLV